MMEQSFAVMATRYCCTCGEERSARGSGHRHRHASSLAVWEPATDLGRVRKRRPQGLL